MSQPVAPLLRELERRKTEFGDGSGQRKLELLRTLERRRLPRAGDVLRLHEVLCFLRAYPDSAELLTQVEQTLQHFGERGDLRRHRNGLVDSGIAGTTTYFRFYPAAAAWLARRWGAHLSIDWEEFEQKERLELFLSQLALYGETPGLDEFSFDVREWIERMKGPAETDATFLVRRFEQLLLEPLTREALLEELDIAFKLAPGPDTPARSREKYAGVTVSYQTSPLSRVRPNIRREVEIAPRAVKALTQRQGPQLIDLARSAMAARTRDLDAFAYGDRNDVRLVDCGDGLQFALIGVVPERRFLLESLYGFLALQNGVPVGYGTYTGLFGSAEVAYTVFGTYRAGEASRIYGRVLANAVHLFGFDSFTIIPGQLGQDNEDAIRSGAWWFYQKLGFRPRESSLLRIMRREQKRMQAKPSYRTSTNTLRRLATENVYLHLGPRRDDVIGMLPLGNVGLHVTSYLAERFGYDRRRAEQVCAREASELLGVRSLRRFSPGERLAWVRWSPLIMILPGLSRWGRANKRALIEVVRAKGGLRESEYVVRFDRHRLLRRAIERLATGWGSLGG
jgi:hypothetical protein